MNQKKRKLRKQKRKSGYVSYCLMGLAFFKLLTVRFGLRFGVFGVCFLYPLVTFRVDLVCLILCHVPFGVTAFALLTVKMCMPKSEVTKNERPDPRKIVNLRSCKEIFVCVQEKNNVKMKVKQNRAKYNKTKNISLITSALSLHLKHKPRDFSLTPATNSSWGLRASDFQKQRHLALQCRVWKPDTLLASSSPLPSCVMLLSGPQDALSPDHPLCCHRDVHLSHLQICWPLRWVRWDWLGGRDAYKGSKQISAGSSCVSTLCWHFQMC